MNAVSPSDDPSPKAFRMEELLVEPLSGVVTGPGDTVHLEPRVMAVLWVLARSPGALVTRQALLAEIWPGGDIYDEALTQCIYQLRQQLCAAAGDNRFRDLVRTVPKRGYMLQANVEPVEPATTTVPGGPEAGSRRGAWWAVVAVLALGVLAIALFWNQRVPEPVGQRPTTMAVLPFLPLLEEQSNPSLEHGMADTLIARLGSLQDTVVRPISSVRHFDTAGRDPLYDGQLLGVDTVVDGSIQQSDGLLRVTVRLLRVADGTTIWADTFEEPSTHIFIMQDAIATRIAEALASRLLPEDRAGPAQGGTTNTQAYDLYLQGRYHLSRLTRVDLLAAIDLFNQAIATDPQYADAWLGLGSAHFRITLGSEGPPLEHFPLAQHAAERALQINPDLAEGHSLLGWVAHWHDWDWDAAEAHFLHAIEMNQEEVEAHLGYAHLLSNIGRHEQAVVEIRRAREISPLYMAAAALEGGFLMRAGLTEEAIRRMEAALDLDPEYWFTHMALAGLYMATGRINDALTEVAIVRRLNYDATWAMANQVGMLIAGGERPRAEAVLADMLRRAEERYVPPYDLAVAYRALGDLDASLRWLQRGYEVREPKMTFLRVDPSWQALAERPGFTKLMQDMDFPPTE